VETGVFGLKNEGKTVDYPRAGDKKPRFWAKNRASTLETCTNVQKCDQILQNHRKGGGKGGQDVQKGGRKIYKKSRIARKKGRDRVLKINPTVKVGGDWALLSGVKGWCLSMV